MAADGAVEHYRELVAQGWEEEVAAAVAAWCVGSEEGES